MASSFRNREFVAFIVPTTLLFTVGVLAVSAAGLSPGWAFAAGFAISIPVEVLRDWLIDWLDARREVNDVAA